MLSLCFSDSYIGISAGKVYSVQLAFLHASRLTQFVASLSQVPALSGFPGLPNGDMQMFPIMYPAVVPGLFSLQNQDQTNRGAGLYAVPALPFTVAGLPSNTLIPLTYNIPT